MNPDHTPRPHNPPHSAPINTGANWPAYPVTEDSYHEPSRGLTKRELFALHATQPGVSEIVTAAGLHCPDNFSVWYDADTRIGSFNEWWSKLTNEERFALSSKVKVQQADALLAELAKDGSP